MGTCTSNCFSASAPTDPIEPVVREFTPPTIDLGDLELEMTTSESGGEIVVEALDISLEDMAVETTTESINKTAESAEDTAEGAEDTAAEEEPPTKPVYPVPMPRATGVVDRSSISFDQGKNFF